MRHSVYITVLTRINDRQYLVGDFDEQCEYQDDEQIVNDADRSDDDVGCLDCTVTDVSNMLRQIVIRRRRRRAVGTNISRQRRALHCSEGCLNAQPPQSVSYL